MIGIVLVSHSAALADGLAEMADQIVFREYLCPVTGYRIDAELARAGEPLLHDIRLAG